MKEDFRLLIKKEYASLLEALEDLMGISGRQFRRMIRQRLVEIDGAFPARPGAIHSGSVITIRFPDETIEYPAESIPLDVLYEDEDMLAVNKPPYMLTHPSREVFTGTLANAIAGYFQEIGLKRKARFVNRLDMNTSGIVLIAKHSYAHQQLSDQEKIKTYQALVEGMPPLEGIVEAPIARDSVEGSVKRIVHPDGKPSKTGWKRLDTNGKVSLLEVRLYTGRTHQIRVHLTHKGWPILGDSLYGHEEMAPRQMLHAASLVLHSIRTNEEIYIEASIPDDFRKILTDHQSV
jgi:23S rRNA pseudouridine1911/1915/1917 synthase